MTRSLLVLVCILTPSVCFGQFSLLDDPKLKKPTKVEKPIETPKESAKPIEVPQLDPEPEKKAPTTVPADFVGPLQPQQTREVPSEAVEEPQDELPAIVPPDLEKPDEGKKEPPKVDFGLTSPTVEETKELSFNLTNPANQPTKVITGKEVSTGPRPDYFRLDSATGKTTIFVPSGTSRTDITPNPADYPSPIPNAVTPEKIRKILQIKDEPKPGGISVIKRDKNEPLEVAPYNGIVNFSGPPEAFVADEKLVKQPYFFAHNQSVKDKRPLMVFMVKDKRFNSYVNSSIENMEQFISFKPFHVAVMDDTNPNWKNLTAGDHPVQLIVFYWSKKEGSKWQHKKYVGFDEMDAVIKRIKKWCRDNNSSPDNAIKFIDPWHLFIFESLRMVKKSYPLV